MLKKLLKYDLQNMFKFLIVFYILALFFATLTRIFFSIDNSLIINIIGQICSGITISMMFNIVINVLMRAWVRFKNNIYGDESYLTHTLPINKKTIYLSKAITSIIALFVSIFIIGLTLFIAYYSKENLELLKNLLLPLTTIYNSSLINILLVVLFILFLEFVNLLQTGYTGLILGHNMNSSKTGFSILYGFIVYMVTQVFAIVSIFITALFDKNIMNLFYTSEIINISTIKTIMFLAIFIYLLIIIINYFINIKLFQRGVNVD